MLLPTGYVVVMMLQDEWRRQAALERTAAARRQRTRSLVRQLPRRRGWLDRVLRRPLVQPAADAG
jgi:hypothetical protein